MSDARLSETSCLDRPGAAPAGRDPSGRGASGQGASGQGASGGALFANDDWSVSEAGLEHRATGYFIARGAVAARRAERLWDWPLQMAEKRWCRPSLFRDAFLAALDRFGIARDAELTRSFALGYGIRAAEAPAEGGFLALAEILSPRASAPPAAVRRPARPLAAAGA